MLIWAQSASLGAYVIAQSLVAEPLSWAIAHDPVTHLAGLVFLAFGVTDLRLARSRATGGRRLATRGCAVQLIFVGGGYALGDRALTALDALLPGESIRAWSVGGTAVTLALCGLWLWRTSPLRGR